MIVTLVGRQDTTVKVHRPNTDGAAVSVRVGAALLYMHDSETVAKFARTWNDAGPASLFLPRETDLSKVAPIAGTSEPAVMFEARDCPPAVARLERPVGRPSYLRVTLGRVLFDVRDRGAFHSTAMAFRRAEELAVASFYRPWTLTPREQAELAAARIFPAPVRTPARTRGAESRIGTARPSPPVQARTPYSAGGALQ
ncbi:hypothetical protein [Pseudonocardia alaniniphila]|uniref:hypothetical protein n=1 Tax=Pseudonocardia alaniniphila TaxID=75291 RepID=UPI003628A7C3